jgi:3'(2'), 5'-bisphosphate nucleotidase
VIVGAMERLLPGVTVVSEEEAEHQRPSALGASFVLVDPLDGTREFIAGRGEFTVNIALISNGAPVLGVVVAPATGATWRGVTGHGAERFALAPGAPAREARERAAIASRPCPRDGLAVAMSRSHLDEKTKAFMARLRVKDEIVSGSSVKFCRVAEGAADVYPRLSPTSEWDIAAGHAVLAAAGGTVVTPQGDPISYGRAAPSFIVPAFVAWGDPSAMIKPGEDLKG